MARKPRIEYPGAFYHIIARGNRKIAIFKDDDFVPGTNTNVGDDKKAIIRNLESFRFRQDKLEIRKEFGMLLS